MTTIISVLIAFVVIIGLPLFITALTISRHKRESRALDEMLFRKEEEE